MSVALLAFAVASCRGRDGTKPGPSPGDTRSRETRYSTGDPALDALQKEFLPTLEANRREFTGQTGPVFGFGAGAVYPQIWLRDSATMIPATRYHFPVEWLTSWLEEHLSHQRSDGQLWDWIAAGEVAPFKVNAPRASQVYRARGVLLSADKNTTATDQEASALDSAAQVFAITGDREWLRKQIVGRRLVDRLDAALEWVLRERLSGRGLVTGALTADWGDVSPVYRDQRAIYRDDETPVVEGLYVSVMTVRAAEALGGLFEVLGEAERAGSWRQRAARLRAAINECLWQEGRGFYRFQAALPGPKPPVPVDDAAMFALGGNGLAILYGVADSRQTARIVATAEEGQRRHGLSTIAGTLLPPFPAGFFKHPIQREEWTYQNGGQWDWWAGRFLLAEFRNGHAEAAHRQLVGIARRVAESGGLHEWYARTGEPHGSPHYAGSVGALSGAVYQGLFGIDSRAEGLALTVRLATTQGSVSVHEPALDRRVAYDWRYDAAARTGRLHFESNVPGTGALRVLLPGGRTPERALLDGRA
ncbi:MAG: hypothetical protein ACHQKZ_02190, partial [Solirubrobacterales bacterium]